MEGSVHTVCVCIYVYTHTHTYTHINVYFKQMLFFELSIKSKNPEKEMIMVSKKILSSKTVFIEIIILESFLRNHDTLKTGIMASENLACHHSKKKIYIIIHIKINNLF